LSYFLKDYTFIDLFAGIGGFRLAWESFETKCVFSSEWNKYAKTTYYKNFGEIPHGDITKIQESDIPAHDILCAGFPCQAFSISGKRLGFEDTRGTLFFDIARIIKYHYPKIILLENVNHFARHDNGKTLQTVVSILHDLGYDIFYQVLNASHFGVPQKRERIYILGFRHDLKQKKFSFPKPTYQRITLQDILLDDDKVKKYIINRNDITMKPPHTKGMMFFDKFASKPIRIGTVNKGGQGERIYDIKGHAITLSAYGGGVGAKTGLYQINGVIRKLAPRECARLMGFPDSFEIHEQNTQAYKQFGNSVVIDILQHVILAMIKQGIFN